MTKNLLVINNRKLERMNKKIIEQATRIKELEAALQEKNKEQEESERLYWSILMASPDAIIVSNVEGEILVASPMAKKIVAVNGKYELLGRKLIEFLDPECYEEMKNNMRKLLKGKKIGNKEYLGKKITGEKFNMEVNSQVIKNQNGKVEKVIYIVRDISVRKKIELALKESEDKYKKLTIALEEKNRILNASIGKDVLTGINNRLYFEDKIQDEIDMSNRYKTKVSLIFFDLDHFKKVNDNYGHDIGDDVLVKVAKTVEKVIRKQDVLARWGGEEFIIFLPHTSLGEANIVAEKIRQTLEVVEHPKAKKVTASFGVAERLWGEYLESWFKRVDQALYVAKQSGRNQVALSPNDDSPEHVQKIIFWNNSWSSGNPDIDQQHKQLLKLSNELVQLALKEVDLEFMLEKFDEFTMYVNAHFEYEKQVIKQMDLMKNFEHYESKQALVDRLGQLREKIIAHELTVASAFKFIQKDIICNHLLDTASLDFTNS